MSPNSNENNESNTPQFSFEDNPTVPDHIKSWNLEQSEQYQQALESSLFGGSRGRTSRALRLNRAEELGQSLYRRSFGEALNATTAPQIGSDVAASQSLNDVYAKPPVDPWGHLPETSNSSPENNNGGDGGEGPPQGPNTNSGNANGPWALEQTTQQRLIEIVNALNKLGGNTGANGVNPRHRSDYERDLEKYGKHQEKERADREDMLKEMSPQGGSSKNLFDFARRISSIGSKTASRLRKRFGKKLQKPKREDYDAQGMKKSPPSKGGTTAQAASKAGGAAEGAGVEAGAAVEGGAVMEGATAAAAGEVAVGGPVGAIAAAATIFAAAVVEFGKAAYQFARAQEAEVRRLAEVGGYQAAGVAILDAQRTMRDVKTAGETGRSSLELTQSISRFEDALQPIESILTNISNSIASGILDTITDVLNTIKPMFEVLKSLYEFISRKKVGDDKPQTPLDWIKQIEEEDRRSRKPMWPEGPIGNKRL